MKGDVSDHRLLTRDVRPHSSYVSSSSADYLITTMKLREHVLASKPKKPGSSNKLIRNMRSAPPFQNRNLDNFPMPYNREDAVRSARGQRADKRNNAVRMTRWRAESGLMKEYSKQMFDFSVHSAKTSAILNGTKVSEEKGDVATRSKSETDYYAALRTNGPTPDGSALHNRRQKVLNSIRIRPHMECQTQFKHERSTSSSNVEHAISDKNRRYRVQSVTESSTRPGSHYGNISLAGSEFIFIPVDESSMVNGWVSDERVTNRRITFDNSLSESNDTDSLDATFGKDPFDDFEDKNNEVNVGNTTRQDQQNCQSTFSPYPRKLLPPSTSSNIRLVSLDEASASESEDEKVEPIEEVKKPEPPPPPPPEKPKSKTRGKKGGKKPAKQKATKVVIVEEEKKVPEPEPEPEPVKVKLILKGPHCWVDDATVTSEPPDLGDFDNPDGANPTSGEQLETNAERQNSAQKLDTTAKTKSLMKDAISANTKPTLGTILKQPNQQSVKDAFDKALQKNVQSPTNANGACDDLNKQLLDSRGVENNLVEVDAEKQSAEEEGDNIILPPFLCPSSEKKSRQAALKDWLACSAFRNAHHGIPIV